MPKTRLNAPVIDRIKPLLARLPYLTDVQYWDGRPVDVNLDLFREHLRFDNISDSHLAAFGLPLSERDQAWTDISDPLIDPRYPLIISRSVRYQSNYQFWDHNLWKIIERSAFVGFKKDHEIFEYTFGIKIHFWDAPDVVTLARVIAGAKQFVCPNTRWVVPRWRYGRHRHLVGIERMHQKQGLTFSGLPSIRYVRRVWGRGQLFVVRCGSCWNRGKAMRRLSCEINGHLHGRKCRVQCTLCDDQVIGWSCSTAQEYTRAMSRSKYRVRRTGGSERVTLRRMPARGRHCS
ncbi:hypothetical protein BH10PLA1_BH10PLA1_05770 [soil metagenome]